MKGNLEKVVSLDKLSLVMIAHFKMDEAWLFARLLPPSTYKYL
jgi:hypothetical protein